MTMNVQQRTKNLAGRCCKLHAESDGVKREERSPRFYCTLFTVLYQLHYPMELASSMPHRRTRASLSINKKFLALAVALLSVVSLFIGIFFPAHQQAEMSKYLDEKTLVIGEITASGVAAGIAFEDAEQVQKQLKTLESVPDAQFAVVYKKDGTLFGSWNKEKAMAAEPMVREILQVSSKTVRHSRMLSFTVIPIIEGQDIIGKLVIGTTLQQLQADVVRNRLIAIAVGVVILLLGSGIFAWQTSRIVKPIRILEAAARRVASGDTNITLTAYSRDEVGVLTEAFATMVSNIRDSIDEVRKQSEAAAQAANEADRARALAHEQKEYLAESVHDMLEVIQNFAKGDLTVSLSIKSNDEIGQLVIPRVQWCRGEYSSACCQCYSIGVFNNHSQRAYSRQCKSTF